MPDKKHRISLDVHPEEHGDFISLQLRARKNSLVDTVRVAMKLLKLFLEHQSEGGTVVLRSKDGQEKEVEILF
jgi:hypothetical protein